MRSDTNSTALDSAFDDLMRTLKALERLSRPERREFPPYFEVSEKHLKYARERLAAYGEDKLMERVARLLALERAEPIAVFDVVRED